MTMTPTHFEKPRSAQQRGGFTLLEILVAVAIMSLLLSIIMVPLRLAFDSFHTGKARGEVQQQAQLVLQQVTGDLRRADFVFPNSYIPGVTDNTDVSPCSQPAYNKTGWNYHPYAIATDKTDLKKKEDPANTANVIGVTRADAKPWDNPSRIDMLFLRKPNSEGLSANVGEDYVVTYYTRRLDISKDFDIVDNPVVLYRAQYPYRYYDKTATPPVFKAFTAGTSVNAEVNNNNYPPISSSPSAITDRNFLWITHNFRGEANLEPLCTDWNTAPPIAGAHTLVTPRDMALVTPLSGTIGTTTEPAEALVPELSFLEEATNGKRIDRVTINMTLAQYDTQGTPAVNGQAAGQRVRVSQTVEVPNVGCTP